VPVLIASLAALVIGAFIVSGRAGLTMLGVAIVAVAAMFAWTWHTGPGVEISEDAIPVSQVEILDMRKRGNTTDYLIRNNSDRWTLTRIDTERYARNEDGAVIDRKTFSHVIEVPPGETQWETLRFFGLEIGLDYELRIVGTEGSRKTHE